MSEQQELLVQAAENILEAIGEADLAEAWGNGERPEADEPEPASGPAAATA